MKKIIIAVITTLCIAGLMNFALPEVNMQEGNWEITVTTDMQGLPYPMPAVTYTDCLAKNNMTPQKLDKSQDCKQTSSKLTGNTYTWTIECNSAGVITNSSGKITYKGTTFSGSISTTTAGMTMKQKITGRRIGACSK